MESSQLTAPPESPRGRSAETYRKGDGGAAAHDPRSATQADSPQNADAANPHNTEGPVDEKSLPRPSRLWLIGLAAGLLVALAILFAFGLIPRLHRNAELKADAASAADAAVPVSLATPRLADATTSVALPGTLRPWREVSIYARTTGYLKQWHADISNHVVAGQLLAEIDAPEVDHQLLEAKSNLQQMKAAKAKAEADLTLARNTAERFEKLVSRPSEAGAPGPIDSVTKQELDEKRAARDAAQSSVEAAAANIEAAEANVKRLTDLQSFEKVTAPFAGVITSRPYDTGAYISAGGTGGAREIYRIAQNDTLRAFVNVPQSIALSIEKGQDVSVEAKERPGRSFVGKVMGTTNYLDQASRSLLTEVKLPNSDAALLPGMYVQATFTITRDRPPLVIPASSLIITPEGTHVAIVKDDHAAHYQRVELGLDFGKEVEVLTGLNAADRIVTNPGERLADGVRVKELAAAPSKG